MKSVSIIGGGIGGLCTGIRLLKNGYSVSIYEKNHRVGGVACKVSGDHGDFEFQYAASIPIDPSSYNEVFEYAGLDPKKYFDVIELTNHYKVFFESGDTFLFTKNIQESREAFEKLFKEPISNYESFLEDSYNKYLIEEKSFLRKPFLHLTDSLHLDTIVSAIKINPVLNAYRYISKYIKNEKLKQCLLFQILYMGISPYEISSVYATIPGVTQRKGLVEIKGGIGAYTQALAKVFEELGGHIYLNSPIDELLIQGNQCASIACEGRLIYSDIIVSNADYCYTLSKLMKNKQTSKKFQMSCSVFILHLAFKEKFRGLHVHNHFICEEFKSEIEKIFEGKLPNTPPVYIYYPMAMDSDFQDHKETSMNLMVRVPNLSFGEITWNQQTIALLRAICINTLCKITGIHEIEKYIIYEWTTTPVDLERIYHCNEGAAFGIAHTFNQSMAFRPQMQLKNITNVFFVGSSIHPGNGVSIVMKGAEMVANQILGGSVSQ